MSSRIIPTILFILALGSAVAQPLVLTGVARDFAELIPKTPGGHPDFNPTEDAAGTVSYGCFDRPSAAKGAVQSDILTANANPDNLPGLIPYERDEASMTLKPGYDAPPNCFRSRFNEWFTTRSPDINRAFFVDLPFVKEGNVYRYDNSAFFPLNDNLVPTLRPQVPSVTTTFGHRQSGIMDGADVSTRNYGFTFELHAMFTYKKNTGQNFSFRGDDDVWVFINDKLVIDLGGVHSEEQANVNIDNLGLVDGKSYYLDFYFAERRVSASRLTITTSLVLTPPTEPEPEPPIPVKVTEGFLFDRDGDGIGDRAEIVLDVPPTSAPSKIELNLEGETERGDWTIAPMAGSRFAIDSKTDFFTKVVTSWDEAAPANQSRALADPAVGVIAGTFPLRDRVGPVILTANRDLVDTSLNQAPFTELVVRFSEPVRVDAPQVLKFKNQAGKDAVLELISRRPDSAVNGYADTWIFRLSPSAPEIAQGWEVAVGSITQVVDAKANLTHVDNPYRPIGTLPAKVVIGDLRAEKAVTASEPANPAQVGNPFVLLTSKGSEGEAKTYIPLRPGTAEDWIRRNTVADGNPGVAVFGFKLTHPAELKISVFDNLGQFVNRTAVTITREDLQSGLLARDPATRAFLMRFAWYPISQDGNLISTGAYIIRAEFIYGIDPKDNVERGTQVKVAKFGFLRGNRLVGLGL